MDPAPAAAFTVIGARIDTVVDQHQEPVQETTTLLNCRGWLARLPSLLLPLLESPSEMNKEERNCTGHFRLIVIERFLKAALKKKNLFLTILRRLDTVQKRKNPRLSPPRMQNGNTNAARHIVCLGPRARPGRCNPSSPPPNWFPLPHRHQMNKCLIFDP